MGTIPRFASILAAGLLLWAPVLFGQDDAFLIGRLTDADTGEPVVFATIRIKGQNKGVISNADGSFRIPDYLLEPATVLRISSMGYRPLEFAVGNLPLGRLFEIKLKPGTILLWEAVVSSNRRRAPSARAVVRRAIRAIPRNYDTLPFSLIGYYRDYQRNESEYINLNEALLEVFDAGFRSVDSTDTRTLIYRSRENKEFPVDSVARRPYDYRTRMKMIRRAYIPNYGGNEFMILRVHDPIRNHDINSFDFINKLTADLLSHHSFYKEDYIRGEEGHLYNIRFVRRRPSYHASGNLYISSDDYAIHKLTYTVRTASEDPGRGIARREKEDYPDLLMDLSLEYRRDGGRMYLNYISFQNSFRSWITPAFDIADVVINMPCRCVVLELTSSPDSLAATDPDLYTILYKDKRIGVREVIVKDTTLYLEPDMNELARTEMLLTMRSAVQFPDYAGQAGELFDVEVRPLRDTKGNLLGKWTHRDYIQFREFFVNRANPGRTSRGEGPFMDTARPLFENQPIPASVPDTLYWMNTPLRSEPTSGGISGLGPRDGPE